jgi:hypothetical protein
VLAAEAVIMLLASHALAASLLGVFLFGEHIRTDAAALAGETLARPQRGAQFV